MARRDRQATKAVDRLDERLDLLGSIVDIGHGRLPNDTLTRAGATLGNARARLGHGGTHTVVALAGSTGSGKSSLFNAIAAAPLSAVGVRRPTTSTSSAAVFGGDASELLDWLGVPKRHTVPEAATAGEVDLAGLVLIDLPDHDSTVATHRAEVDRLVQVVDVFVWVVDPQKYADAALHDGYLRRFAGHSDVTLVVLNHADRLAVPDRRRALDDLHRLLVADGMERVRVMATSAATGEGLGELTGELAAQTSARRAFVSRLAADVDWIASDLAAAVGPFPAASVSASAQRHLAEALAGAAGVDLVAEAVGAAHRQRGVQATGWPPTRWITKLRPDPLRRLGLDRRRATSSIDDGGPVARTSRAGPDPVARARIADAVRALVDETGSASSTRWHARLTEAATNHDDDIADALDRAIGATSLPVARPRWWAAMASLQWLLAAVMLVGVVWLAAMGVVAWLQLPDLPAPDVGALPLPTVLAVGGALAGLVVAAIARWATAAGAQRRASTARRHLTASVAAVADERIIVPVNEELAAQRRLGALIAELS